MISSASPSLKYSCSLSPLRLAKGSTAIDLAGATAAAGASIWLSEHGCERGRGVDAVHRRPGQGALHGAGDAAGIPSRSPATSAGVWMNRLAITACTEVPVNGASPTSIS